MNGTIKKDELLQEFVIRVKVTTVESDSKTVRELLDRVEKRLSEFKYTDDTGSVVTVLVHPN